MEVRAQSLGWTDQSLLAAPQFALSVEQSQSRASQKAQDRSAAIALQRLPVLPETVVLDVVNAVVVQQKCPVKC